MNYGKFLIWKEQNRKRTEEKTKKLYKWRKLNSVPGTDEGDYQVKLRSLIRFLEDGE